ncbi:hypothetical protein [Polaribacter sp.]|uniref:hypothetical protein n=1 Tax=Polaribacter sp. TaxID=1920175 RepID=UPI003F6CDBF9
MKNLDITLNCIAYFLKIFVGVKLLEFLQFLNYSISQNYVFLMQIVFVFLAIVHLVVVIYFKLKNGAKERENKDLQSKIYKEQINQQDFEKESKEFLKNNK